MEEQKYKLYFEKTYWDNEGEIRSAGDSYESTINASRIEEALEKAQEKLIRVSMYTHYLTDVTNAMLVSEEGRRFPVPNFSKERGDENGR